MIILHSTDNCYLICEISVKYDYALIGFIKNKDCMICGLEINYCAFFYLMYFYIIHVLQLQLQVLYFHKWVINYNGQNTCLIIGFSRLRCNIFGLIFLTNSRFNSRMLKINMPLRITETRFSLITWYKADIKAAES